MIAETERLRLREMSMDDVSNLQLIFSDPVAMQHYPSTKDEEETKKWIQWNLDSYRGHRHGLWAVELKETNQFIGQCGLIAQNIRNCEEIEIGYLFTRNCWGNGYATEAAIQCRNLAFQHFNYPKIVSYIGPGNTPSQNVAIRTGLKLETKLKPSENRRNKEVWVYSKEAKKS